MSLLRVAPIVEGHGEAACIRDLLTRIWIELLGGEYIDVLQPIRHPRNRLVQSEHLMRAVMLAHLKIKQAATRDSAPGMILLMVDSEPDPPCELAPRLCQFVADAAPHVDFACVLPNLEYETWFVASAESLAQFLDLAPSEPAVEDPEAARSGKGWIERRFRGVKYSETLDQPSMTAAMDLALCRSRCPSFDKLCRELEGRLGNR